MRLLVKDLIEVLVSGDLDPYVKKELTKRYPTSASLLPPCRTGDPDGGRR